MHEATLATIKIDYTHPDQSSYRATLIHPDSGDPISIAKGDPVSDYREALAIMRANNWTQVFMGSNVPDFADCGPHYQIRNDPETGDEIIARVGRLKPGPYILIERLSDELIMLAHRAHGKQLWCRMNRKAHKTHKCAQCGSTLAADSLPYRPVGNDTNRGDRVCAACILFLIRAEYCTCGGVLRAVSPRTYFLRRVCEVCGQGYRVLTNGIIEPISHRETMRG